MDFYFYLQFLPDLTLTNVLYGLVIATLDLLLWFIFALKVAEGARKWNQITHWWQYPIIGYFVFKDWLYVRTWFRVMFLMMGRAQDKTLTEALRYILHGNEFMRYEWRWKLAYFICRYLIEPFDRDHCKINKLK